VSIALIMVMKGVSREGDMGAEVSMGRMGKPWDLRERVEGLVRDWGRMMRVIDWGC
jgi:hypothetical protein